MMCKVSYKLSLSLPWMIIIWQINYHQTKAASNAHSSYTWQCGKLKWINYTDSSINRWKLWLHVAWERQNRLAILCNQVAQDEEEEERLIGLSQKSLSWYNIVSVIDSHVACLSSGIPMAYMVCLRLFGLAHQAIKHHELSWCKNGLRRSKASKRSLFRMSHP